MDFDVGSLDAGKGTEEFSGDGFGEGLGELAAGASHHLADDIVGILIINSLREVVGAAGIGQGKFEPDGDFENLAVGGFSGQNAVVREEAQAVKGEGVGTHDGI